MANTGHNRDHLREHNLSAIMSRLHNFGTLSRAQLTVSTGLNRTTIANLTTELKTLGLVYESLASEPSSVGRPSVIVSLRRDVVAIAVSTALDATTVGVVNLSGEVLKKVQRTNPPHLTPAMAVQIAHELIAQLWVDLPAGTRVIGIGVAIPGQLRVAEGIVRLAPAFKWSDVPFGPMLSQLSKLPVFIGNDASLGCLAERRSGSARNFTDIIYLFGGANGVGGGVVINGEPLRGAAGYASELGHIRISDSPGKDYSDLVGTLESAMRRDKLLKLLGLKVADEYELESAILKTTSPEALKEIRFQVDALAVGIGNVVNIFNPQIVILSGFLASLYKRETERLMKQFRKSTLVSAQEEVIIAPGELKSELFMIGAAELPINNLLRNPSKVTELPIVKGRKP